MHISLFGFSVFLVTYLFKISESINQFPADPGVDYLVAASRSRWSSIFQFADGQLIVVNRLLSILVSYLPVNLHAIATGFLVSVIWAAGGTVLVAACLRITHRTVWSLAVGLLVILAPASSESQLGNNGGTRWVLYLTIAFLFSSSETIELISGSRIKTILLLGSTVLLGLTNPMTFVMFPALLLASFKAREHPNRNILKTYLASGILIFITTLIQIFVLAMSNHEIGRHSTATYSLWAGAGFYWKFILGAPIATSFIAIVFIVHRYSERRRRNIVILLITHAASIYTTTYIFGGIADRYLIAPFVLASSALFIALSEREIANGWYRNILPFTAIVVIGVASVIWFSPTGYLTSGEDWSSQLPSAEVECELQKSGSAMMIFSDGHPNDVPCDYIQSGK